MTRTLVITIWDTPKATNEVALAIRRFILRNTEMIVWDNCAVGSEERPRRLTAEFPAVVREVKDK